MADTTRDSITGPVRTERWKQAPAIRSLLVGIGIGLVIWSLVQTAATIRSSHWNLSRDGGFVYQLTYSLSPEGKMRFARGVEELDPDNDDVVSLDFRTRRVGNPKPFRIEVWLVAHSVSPNVWKLTPASPLSWEVAVPQIAAEFQRRGYPGEQTAAILSAPAAHVVHNSTRDAIESIWRSDGSAHLFNLVMAAVALAIILLRRRLATLVCTTLNLTKIGACQCGYPLVPNAARCPECGTALVIQRPLPVSPSDVREGPS